MLSAEGSSLDHVIKMEVPDDILIERICGRRIHKASGRTYHVQFKPPKVPGKDDVTGEPLSTRKDDNRETAGARLATYHEQTAPVRYALLCVMCVACACACVCVCVLRVRVFAVATKSNALALPDPPPPPPDLAGHS